MCQERRCFYLPETEPYVSEEKTMKPMIALFSLTIMLSACSGSGQYPITGCDSSSTYPISCEPQSATDGVQSLDASRFQTGF